MPRYELRKGSQGELPPPSPNVGSRPFSGGSRTSSSRSVVSSVRTAERAEGRQGVVPLSLVDYAEPKAKFVPYSLAADPHQTDKRAQAFLLSSHGEHLRKMERKYAGATRSALRSTSVLRGSSILILGCGASRHLLTLLLHGPARVVFVDTSAPALAKMSRIFNDAGYSGIVDADFVCEDAWTFVDKCEVDEFDVVMATKCLGQVFKVDPESRSVYGLLNKLSDVVPADGIVLVDHHEAFARAEHGRSVALEAGTEHFDAATIGGRFDDDVCYSSDVTHHAFDKVLTWTSNSNKSSVQQWTQFIYRKQLPRRVTRPVAIDPYAVPVPTPFPSPPDVPYDDLVDKINPRPFTGVKRIVTQSDHGRLDPDTMMPKFDGVPGVLIIDGQVGVFIAHSKRVVFRLPKVFTQKMVLVAELLRCRASGSLLAVLGVICVANAECDPLDYGALAAIRHLIAPLHSVGIFSTGPGMCGRIDGADHLVFGRLGSLEVAVPVDGLNFTINGRNGHFVKPVEKNTLDIRSDEMYESLTSAWEVGGFEGSPIPQPVNDKWPPGTVIEMSPSARVDTVFSFVRVRPDKAFSAPIGRLVADITAARCVNKLFGPGGVKEMVRLVSKW
ncbi:methyltransferase [Penicillium brevicompactum tetramycovirus 1]|uniref:Methyltransferase n=1 Tax=Penicillium brevicompactum tetramycovirus 1 TaxID=2485923 RepID=A0A3G3C4W9_9VIRU|nr:methyltransferase [Penicillium brevicompactum tetramycovirus 1]AYP71803.1 methyltransferase [Penicillium brevicompactum tetramycovirus 1]